VRQIPINWLLLLSPSTLAEPQTVTLYESLFQGAYCDYFSGEAVELPGSTPIRLKQWGYRVFVKKE
jgi:hypothetical protein